MDEDCGAEHVEDRVEDGVEDRVGTGPGRRAVGARRGLAALVVAGGLGAGCTGAVLGGALDGAGVSRAGIHAFVLARGPAGHGSGTATRAAGSLLASKQPRGGGSAGAAGHAGHVARSGDSDATSPATSARAGPASTGATAEASSANGGSSPESPSSISTGTPSSGAASPVPVAATLPPLSSPASALVSTLDGALAATSLGTSPVGAAQSSGTQAVSGTGGLGSVVSGL